MTAERRQDFGGGIVDACAIHRLNVQGHCLVALMCQRQMLGNPNGAGWRMRTTAFDHVGRPCRDHLGAILRKFTIAFLPLLSVAAVAMDLNRVIVVKQILTNAVDAAALAVGRQLLRDELDITALAQGFIRAHDTATDVGNLTNLAAAMQVNITAPARVGTVFLSILTTPFVDYQYRAWIQTAAACELNSV